MQEERQRKALTDYVTDALKILTENTAKEVGGQYLRVRYAELIAPARDEEADRQDAADIIQRIKDKAKQIGGDGK